MRISNKGFFSLVVVIIVAAAALLIALSVSFLSREESIANINSQEGNKARAVAESCLQQALLKLKQGSSSGIILRPSYGYLQDNDADNNSYEFIYKNKNTSPEIYKEYIYAINTSALDIKNKINNIRLRFKINSYIDQADYPDFFYEYYNGDFRPFLIYNDIRYPAATSSLSSLGFGYISTYVSPKPAFPYVPILNLEAQWENDPATGESWTEEKLNKITEIGIALRLPEGYDSYDKQINLFDIYLEINTEQAFADGSLCSVDIGGTTGFNKPNKQIVEVKATSTSPIMHSAMVKTIKTIINSAYSNNERHINVECLGYDQDTCKL